MTKTVDIDLLVPFENHPFKERSGIEQQELTESIKENGLLEAIIVRPFPAGKYEIISGHKWLTQTYTENMYCQVKKLLPIK